MGRVNSDWAAALDRNRCAGHDPAILTTRLAGFGSVAKLSDPDSRFRAHDHPGPACGLRSARQSSNKAAALGGLFIGGSKETSVVRPRHGDAVADIDRSGCHDVGVHGQEHVAFPGGRAPEWESMRPLAMSISAGPGATAWFGASGEDSCAVECLVSGVGDGECSGSRSAGDPVVGEGGLGDQGSDGAGEVTTLFGPVAAGADEWSAGAFGQSLRMNAEVGL